jgi:hypothetical protein
MRWAVLVEPPALIPGDFHPPFFQKIPVPGSCRDREINQGMPSVEVKSALFENNSIFLDPHGCTG